ncbi:MAG: glutathione synthetase ATP-binding domain-like protein [Monoraphidium minutum]|nr:MAG: glutathione synthetase ATP-binding domain-like protein [Monoraphidium minutum]
MLSTRRIAGRPCRSIGYDAGGIRVTATRDAQEYAVEVTADAARPMLLHWAVDEWVAPADDVLPPGTNRVDAKAVQTPFAGGRTVTLRFPADAAPERVVFVLKETEPENWISNGSQFTAQLKAPDLSNLLEKVLSVEGDAGHWSLLNRFNLAVELLDGLDTAGPKGMAFLFVWLRLSAMKLLTWSRKSNYQSKDIAWVQKVTAERMSEKARTASDPWCRLYARLALAGLPRGGGNGDDIRMGILHVMRDNGIKEGHRPGLDEPFLEQWHQKLHQNTTQEDVAICEAYLAFLHSGNHDDYWRVLWERGNITKEYLENMNIPIKAWPMHLPHLIGPMKHYLWILKTCHSGADMDTAAEMCKGYMDEETRWMLFDMLGQRNEWWVPGKIVDIRGRISGAVRAPGASRDLMLLDIALDSYFRTCIERSDWASLSGDSLLDMGSLVLRNALLTFDSEDLAQCRDLWGRLAGAEGRWGRDWALAALAAAQRTEISLSSFADTLYGDVQPHAEAFGKRCGIDEVHTLNFGEEVVRSQGVFLLGTILQKLEPQLRSTAGAGAWQVVSQASVPAAGEVVRYDSLADIQGATFDSPVVVLAERLGGNEDIPAGVVAVLTESATDVLSHVAIRARSQDVLLATCFDDDVWGTFTAMAGHTVALDVTATGDVRARRLEGEEAAAAKSASSSVDGGGAAPLRLARHTASKAWVLGQDAFGEGLVGAKALNLKKLGACVPEWIQVPRSLALPFGTFERVLALPENASAAAEVKSLLGALKGAGKGAGAGVPPQLAQLRELVASQLPPPAQLAQELDAALAAAGLASPGDYAPGAPALGALWRAVCGVWASKWGDRAWLSRRACGVAEDELVMSVLLQQVIPAEYAFVLHTADPITGAAGTLFGEVVPGMGETLVGNHPGRALSFRDGPEEADEGRLLSLPSKRVALRAPPGGTLIARSDTNGEDLEAFAGAGLYDSIPAVPLAETLVDAAGEPLLWDAPFRQKLIDGLVEVGGAVQDAFGGVPQDVEGVWAGGRFAVVQARPQVL